MSMRCFIAIEVPEDIQDAMGRVQEKLRAANADVKWTEPRNIHLTTKFLGDVDDVEIPKVCGVMTACALEARAMELEIAGLGTFPPAGAPRVVWVGVGRETEPLAHLVDALEQGIDRAVGIPPEHRPYHAHLTLGRVRSTRNAARLVEKMGQCGPVALGAFTADSLTLFMSELTRGGSVYTRLATAKMGSEK